MRTEEQERGTKMETAKKPEAQTGEAQTFPGLFNPEIQKRARQDGTYAAMVLEQWKTANEQTANISSQRNNINNFYMSLLSLLIGGILLSERVMAEALVSKTITLVIIMALGVVCCRSWINQVEKCRRINAQKFAIITQLEKELPANAISYESQVPEPETESKKKHRNLSDYEKNLAFVFGIAIILIVVVMLLEMWWEPICSLF